MIISREMGGLHNMASNRQLVLYFSNKKDTSTSSRNRLATVPCLSSKPSVIFESEAEYAVSEIDADGVVVKEFEAEKEVPERADPVSEPALILEVSEEVTVRGESGGFNGGIGIMNGGAGSINGSAEEESSFRIRFGSFKNAGWFIFSSQYLFGYQLDYQIDWFQQRKSIMPTRSIFIAAEIF